MLLIFIGIFKYDLHNRYSNTLLWFIGIILFYIAAFRYYNGGDTLNYATSFKLIPALENITASDYTNFRYQHGYIFFVSLLKSIYNNFLIQQIVTALFVNIVVFRFIRKYSVYAFFTTLIYFLLNYFEYNMEVMRECIAVALGLLAYESIQNKRYIVSGVLIYLAYQFHISALILVLLPFLANINFTKKSFYIIISIAVFIPTIYMAVPNLEYYAIMIFNQDDWTNENYLQQEYNQELSINFYITHILKYIIIPFSLIWYINKRQQIEYNGLIYAFAILQLLSMFSYAFYRFANYFAPFYWIAVSTAMCMLLKENRKWNVAIFIVFLMMFLYMYQSVQLQWNDITNEYFYNRYIPYNSVFFTDGY